MSMASELEEQITILKKMRQAHSTMDTEFEAAYEKFCLENSGLMNSLSSIKMEEAAISETVRELTIQAYLETQNKKPAPGVGIRLMKVFNYEAEKAKSWAVEHRFYNLLDLNAGKFKKAAEGLNLDFVDITEKPTATISEVL